MTILMISKNRNAEALRMQRVQKVLWWSMSALSTVSAFNRLPQALDLANHRVSCKTWVA